MLTLVRGLPGSGKSTLARKMVENGEADVHVETDMWFTGADGVYRFNPDRLADDHAECQSIAAFALGKGLRVVVSNTFSRRWEMEPYMIYNPTIVEATGDYGNVHGVPESAVQRMKERWENLEEPTRVKEKAK